MTKKHGKVGRQERALERLRVMKFRYVDLDPRFHSEAEIKLYKEIQRGREFIWKERVLREIATLEKRI